MLDEWKSGMLVLENVWYHGRRRSSDGLIYIHLLVRRRTYTQISFIVGAKVKFRDIISPFLPLSIPLLDCTRDFSLSLTTLH